MVGVEVRVKPIADMTDEEFLAAERLRLERGKRAVPREQYVTRLERFIAIIDRMNGQFLEG